MDKRHTGIVEGAGLEESRINTDFADWLKRWGSPMLLGILVLALGYRGWIWFQERQVQALDSAFIELDYASQSGNPESLMQVAQAWDGRASVSHQARLEAADRYLLAHSTGVKPGGVPGNPEDRANETETANYLNLAESLYRDVYQATSSKKAYTLFTLRALSGLSALAGTRGDYETARSQVSEMIELSEQLEMVGLAEALRDRLSMLERAPQMAPLLSQEEIAAYRQQMAPIEDGDFQSPEEFLQSLEDSPEAPSAAPEGESTETPAPDQTPEEETTEPNEGESTSQGG